MNISAPNYTQVPNVFLDEMIREMNEAELKVALVIIRETFGWHRKTQQLSLSQIQDKTGLSRQGAINGIKSGLQRSIIYRVQDGSSYRYGLVVNEVDQNGCSSQRSRPEVVNEVDQLSIYRKKGKKSSSSSSSDSEYSKWVRTYEHITGQTVDPYRADQIKDWTSRISLAGWEYALKEARDSGKANRWKYIKAILVRVENEGLPADKPKSKLQPSVVLPVWEGVGHD